MKAYATLQIENDSLRARVAELEAEVRASSRRALIWESVSHELGICYEPDEEEPGDTAVHDIREIKADRDRLREVVVRQAEALGGLFADGDYCMPGDTPIVVDSAAKALRAAVEVK